MIFCHDKIYGKVWKIDKQDKYLDLQMSTSEKKQDGTYINSSWYPRVIGHAFNSLKDKLKEGDRICINTSKLYMEKYNDQEGKSKSRLRFLILEAEPVTPAGEQSSAPAATESSSELPW